MSIQPLTFTGVSRFLNDFQTILNRAVSIAAIPIEQLHNRQTDILQEKTLAGNLSAAVADVAASLANLGAISSNGLLAASSTDSSKVTATVAGATPNAYYSITNISSIAKAASETSAGAYEQEGSAPANSTLTVGGTSYPIAVGAGQPYPQTLQGLADAINASGAGVAASILTDGSTQYLSVTPTGGAPTPSLADDATGASLIVPTSLTLTVGTNTYNIDLGANQAYPATLAGLRDAINAIPESGVTATVLTAGDNENYLSVSANSTGATTLALTDSLTGANLLTSNNQGADTVFKLNGVSVDRSTTSVNDLISGVTLNISATTLDSAGQDTGESIGISFGPATGALSSALRDLVTKYNTVAGQVNAQIGPAAGLLSGNSIVHEVREAMQAVASYYGGSGSIQSLSDLGIELSDTGQMSFDSTKLDSLTTRQISDALSFLGSATTGLGGLASTFSAISNPITGTIAAQQHSWGDADTRLTNQINDMTDRVNRMQQALSAKLQAADALLASLESQQNLLTASIRSLDFMAYGYNNTAPSAFAGS